MCVLFLVKTFNPSVIPATNVLEVVAVSVKTTPSPNLETLHSLYSFLAPLCEEKQLRRVLHATVFNLTVVSPGKNAFVFVKNLLEQVLYIVGFETVWTGNVRDVYVCIQSISECLLYWLVSSVVCFQIAYTVEHLLTQIVFKPL